MGRTDGGAAADTSLCRDGGSQGQSHMYQRTLSHIAANAVEPRSARAGSRTSGEGQAVGVVVRQAPRAPAQQTASANLLRHNLTAPEKKTLNRIEAQRRSLLAGVHEDGTPVERDSLGARIFDHLRLDRGLAGNVADDDYATLAGRLIDQANLSVPAASILGVYLREVGATERGLTTPERVKRALQILSDVLYDDSVASGPIPQFVRELKLEKRDGGLQIVAHLRFGASQTQTLEALTAELGKAGYSDIVVRAESAPVTSTKTLAAVPSAR